MKNVGSLRWSCGGDGKKERKNQFLLHLIHGRWRGKKCFRFCGIKVVDKTGVRFFFFHDQVLKWIARDRERNWLVLAIYFSARKFTHLLQLWPLVNCNPMNLNWTRFRVLNFPSLYEHTFGGSFRPVTFSPPCRNFGSLSHLFSRIFFLCEGWSCVWIFSLDHVFIASLWNVSIFIMK